MKFMKLGSKPDTFQTAENRIRYVVSELATDIVVQIGDVKFYLHKFPLLSKSARLQKLLSTSGEDKIVLYDIPGGPAAFETCAKFCYGMTVTLNAHNVVPTRCAAEYLEMHETVDKGNLVYKLDVFLSSSIFRSWKDSIIVLQSSKPLSPLSEDLGIVTHCVDAIAVKASTDVSKVDWSYTYSRRKATEEENGNGLRVRAVPLDWWAEDLSELEIDLYKRVIVNIKNKGLVPSEVVGEALKAYAYRKLPGSGKNVVPNGDLPKFRTILETVVSLLPSEKGCVSCSFLLKLLKAAVSADSDPRVKREIVRRVGQQLEEASVGDLLIPACEGSELMYDVEIVREILEESVMQDRNLEIEEEIPRPGGILTDASKLMVAKLVDGYLLEIAKDRNLPLSTFVGIAEMVSGFSNPGFSNPVHDGMYRAIDTYLKEHPGISKSERKRICRLMDCKKLSANACMHAVQNERLPLRVVVQVLFFEQVRAAAASSSGGSTPDPPKAIRDLNCYNHSHGGSSRSATTNTEEEWGDAMASAEELRALRGEVAGLRLGNGGPSERDAGRDRGPIGKVKGLIMSRRIASKIWSRKGAVGGSHGDNSGSDSSESPGSSNNTNTTNNNNTYNHNEEKRGRHSVS